MDFNKYMLDGADAQARATLAYLSEHEGITASWDDEFRRYLARPIVGRWENGREQGYIISLKSNDYLKQLNIAFFEYRNSDSICAIKWEELTINHPTIDTAKFGDIYKTKYDVSHSVGYGKAAEMAEWIYEQLKDFWKTIEPIKEDSI